MRTKIFLAAVAASLLATGAAFAGNGSAKMHYAFLGQLTATPANGGVSITVVGGTKAALRAMLGQPVTQTFAYGEKTEFLKWADGIPTVVSAGDLAAGDYVRVNVNAPRAATLAEIEQQPAGLVGDHGATLNTPNQPLYMFRGTLASATSSTVTLHVTGRRPPGDEAADRPVGRPDLRRRRRDDLPALAGQGADRDRRIEARRRRQDRRPDPRRQGLDAPAGRGHRCQPRR